MFRNALFSSISTLLALTLLAAPPARGRSKLGVALRGRRGAVQALRDWAAGARDPRRPLVWFHAASVGEGRQAEAVLTRLREARPSWQIAYTYSSPSAARWAAAKPAVAPNAEVSCVTWK